ncbi:acyl-CoA thioesterase [Tichowtungia aerotolerans]|uniref:Thioesterase n=1 Tax=Tichowtungia aerotolerans TaxID=2697043 RepID=A0A6P1M0K2_9BACT|nr:thioesterase family protein [Tichowtungia aerotolerans]QHI68319.1 thioesterase [Tichowtungia aerotolerans]
MARIKLELPETFPFSTELTVRITDLNYGGHLGNADTLVLIHEARVRFLKSFGYSEIDVEGYGTIMLDSVILYKAQAFAGDVLVVEVAAGDFSRLGCDIFYRLTNKETGAVVATAKTGVAVFDYQNQKRVSPPEAFVQKLQGRTV